MQVEGGLTLPVLAHLGYHGELVLFPVGGKQYTTLPDVLTFSTMQPSQRSRPAPLSSVFVSCSVNLH